MMGGDISYGNTTRILDPKIRLLGVMRYTRIARAVAYHHIGLPGGISRWVLLLSNMASFVTDGYW